MLVQAHVERKDFRSVCVREIQKSLNQSVKRLLETKIEALGVGHLFEVQQSAIKRVGGEGLIIFQGLMNHTADSIKSLEGYDVAWCEEAQSISQRSLDLLRPTIRKESSELWFTWNPYLPTDPIDSLLRSKNCPGGAVVRRVNFQDNPWMPEVMKVEMAYDRDRDPDKYAHVWLGEYIRNSESRVFRNWKVEEFETPHGVTHYFGADWGFATDPTVLVRCNIDGRTMYIDEEVYQVGCEIDDTPALFSKIQGSAEWVITADCARPETISYMQSHGYPRIRPATKGAGSVVEGVEFLKSCNIVVHPRCKHTIDELTMYSYKEDKHTGTILPILEDKKNHVIDALRYACESFRKVKTVDISFV